MRLNESQLRSVRGHPWLTIEEEEDDEEEAEPSGPTATHVGGGWYRLNGGSLVQGRDNLPTNCEVV